MNEYDPKVGGTLNEAVYKQPMRMWNGYVVLQHDSNRKITNGAIDHTGQEMNGYSKNSDKGNYFCASEFPGKDQSNGGSYHYYCLVKPELIYDMEKNPKKYDSTEEAMEHEPYISGRWYDGAIAVMSHKPTPISFIEYNDNYGDGGGIYDAEWHFLRPTGLYNEKRKNLAVAKKIKPFQNVEVPEFLHAYDYNQLLSAPGY